MSSEPQEPRQLRLLFAAGVVGGLALATVGALTGGRADNLSLPPGAIARVNTAAIMRADLIRALKAVSSGKRNPLSEADKAAILQRLIEEELLVQRALSQNLAKEDPVLRSALVSAVTRNVITRSRARPVAPERLRDYFERNKARFAIPARVYVRAVYFAKDSAKDRTEAFDRALAQGVGAADLVQRFDGETPLVPAGLLPMRKLEDYIGSVPVTALESLRVGQWSKWIADKDGLWRLYLVDRTRARTPALQKIRDQVEAVYRDERDDAALRTYLDRLKRDADLVLSPDAPQ